MKQRKLQIFVSSTYEDLVPQRFAAIQAILKAGHIPAAMEQFSPGEATAWETIRSWIDQSDAFILILGGRYGSIDPHTGKSFVHLEYEHAVERNKPFCSLVVNEAHHEQRVKEFGLSVDERVHRAKYDDFRRMVTDRVCEFWSDVKDVQLAIFQKLPEWDRNPQLVGWVRSDELSGPEVTNEFARLSRENRELQAQLEDVSGRFDGLTFEELVGVLRNAPLNPPPDSEGFRAALEWCDQGWVTQIVAGVIEAKPLNAGELFDCLHQIFSEGGLAIPVRAPYQRMEAVLRSLFSSGLITSHRVEPQLVGRISYTSGEMGPTEESLQYGGGSITYKLTDLGRRFRNRMLRLGERDERRKVLWTNEPNDDVQEH